MVKYNLICFGFMPWSNMWKRNQSMMAEMAKFDFINQVIFVNPDISLRQLFKQTVRNRNKGIQRQLFPRQIHSGIWIYTLFHLLPVSLQIKVFEGIESRLHLNRLLQLNGQLPYILFMNCPNIHYPYPLDELLKNAAFSIFDFSDDFIQLINSVKGKTLYSFNIETYAHAADMVLTVNDYLKAKYSYLNHNIHVVKNATNYANFDRKEYATIPFLEELKSENRTIIGYSGISNISRIDVDILEYLFSSRPEWRFVFVGYKGEELADRFSCFENFVHSSAVNYQQLPDYLAYFHVTIVPFQINDHTKGNNLLKFHDYLAMGKPVVTTNIGGAEDLNDVVYIADTPAAFLSHIETALADDNSELILQRKKLASDNSWPNRIKELENKLISDLNNLGA